MKTLTARQHQGLALAAVVVFFALGWANYAKHGTYASRYAAASVMSTPQTTDTTFAITDTAPAVVSSCESQMADLQQGRPTGVELSGGTIRTFLEPGTALAETLTRAEILDAFWPGRRLLLLNTQFNDGSHRADSSALIGCNGDRLTLIESGSGPAIVDGDVLRIDELLSTSGAAADWAQVRHSRSLRVIDGRLCETEPALHLSEFAPMVATQGLTGFGMDGALTAVAAIAPMTGRYRLLPETAVDGVPEREIVLRPDGLFQTRHSPDDVEPFPARSFDWGQWYAVYRPETMPAGTASIHLAFMNRPEITFGYEDNRLTLGNVVYVRDPAPTARVWRHAAGDFQTLGGGWWYEKSPGGEFSFIEQSRTAEAVELFDPARNCHVRLTGADAAVRCASDLQWRVWYSGGWEGIASVPAP